MDARTRVELTQALRRQRVEQLKEFFDAEDDLRVIGEDRESELEERAQEERTARVLARLDDRSLAEIRQIDAALVRMLEHRYARCEDCRSPIPTGRLRALPTAAYCVECAREREARPERSVEMPPRHPGGLPADLEPLFDGEVEDALRELVRQDGRVDMEELRIVCRHGVVRLEGAVPSEGEHQIVQKLLTDVAGCEDVVDRLRVSELSWERAERSPVEAPQEPPPPGYEPSDTEDIVRSTEEGVDWIPPDRPPSEEE